MLLFGQRPDILFKMFFRRRHRFHDLPVQQPSKRSYICHLGIILEPDGMRETTPWKRKLRLDAARRNHLIGFCSRPRLVLILLQIIRFRGNTRENRLRRARCRYALEHRQNFQCVDASYLQAKTHRDIARRRHIRSRRRSNQPLLGELRAPILRYLPDPRLFPANVQVMAPGSQAGLNYR